MEVPFIFAIGKYLILLETIKKTWEGFIPSFVMNKNRKYYPLWHGIPVLVFTGRAAVALSVITKNQPRKIGSRSPV